MFEDLGAIIRYDTSALMPEESKLRGYLRRTLGEDYFFDVHEIVLKNAALSDNQLGQLKHLRGLRVLNLNLTTLDGASLSHLKSLKDIRYLELIDTGVSDGELEHINHLPE